MKRLYRLLKAKISEANFALGKSPKIANKNDFHRLIPQSYKAVILITADFELAWAWRYGKSGNKSIGFALEKARQERANIPQIIHLCTRFNIPITWATVGHLFLDACHPEGNCKHPEIPKIEGYRGPFWDFDGVDWFEHDPGSNVAEAPAWYAPDLIQQIRDAKIPHEIGCHTFSHIDCRDAVCPPKLFLSEVRKCQELAARSGLQLKSFVHPGHTIGNLDILKMAGFSSYQTDPGNILGYPEKHNNGLWELKRTSEFVLREGWSIDYHIYRYQTIIERAIKTNTVCNFWFHPSISPVFINRVLPAIFEYIHNNRDLLYVTTVGNYVDWLQQ